MINVKHKTCQSEGCKKRPTFGFEGGKEKYCVEHKSDDMINVKDETCQSEGCKKRPTFGFEGGKAKYCKEHKSDGMVDVKSKMCQHTNCHTHASYGFPQKQPSHCTQHKQADMIKNPRRKCITCKKNSAIYGNVNTLDPIHCERCKDDDEINHVYKICSKCQSLDILDDDGLCTSICAEFYKRKIYKFKENFIKQTLEINQIEISSYDRPVDPACGLERPDFVIELPEFIIIVECDENQHKSYASECEQTRMFNITQSYGGTPVLWIRFNPDNYIDITNKFYHGQENLEKKKRHSRLVKIIKEAMTKTVDDIFDGELAKVYYLYYDNFNSRKSFMKCLVNLNFE